MGFTATNYAVDEDSGSAMFCFTATGNLAPELTAVVSVTSEPITAQGNRKMEVASILYILTVPVIISRDTSSKHMTIYALVYSHVIPT